VKWSEVKWVTVKFLGTKVPYTLEWPYNGGTWLYFIWCVYVGMFWQLWGCFGNMCTWVYCVLYCLYCVFVLFRLCIFILICFVCTSVRITATEWQPNCSNYYYYYYYYFTPPFLLSSSVNSLWKRWSISILAQSFPSHAGDLNGVVTQRFHITDPGHITS
jgi:hypothetical protein